MKKIFTFLFCGLLCSLAFGQGKEAIFPKAGPVLPVVDGVLDDVWADVDQHDIIVPFRTETATVGAEGTTYWKAVWADAGIYVIVVVNDNVWSPYTGVSGTNDYMYDKVEMYFDTNYLLEDGKGGQVGTDGNRQIAPNPNVDNLDGQMLSGTVQGATYNFAFKVEDPTWNLEMFVPWEAILDKDGNPFDKSGIMGFDVQVTDNDDGLNARNRVYWSNAGGKDESWNNMDDAGHVTLADVPTSVDIESIAITGETAISTDNGTVQLTAAVLPVDYTQTYKWEIVEGAKMATISNTGLVTAKRENGTVKVHAVSADGFVASNDLTITISNQHVTLEEISLLKNGQFNQGTNNVGFWGVNPATSWVVEDGWLTGTAAASLNIWDVMAYQAVDVDATTKYIIKFKAKASSDMTVPFITEDIKHDYKKEVVSSSPYRAETQWNIPVTTQEQQFEFDVTHTSFVEGSVYQPSFQIGQLTGTVSVTDVYMYAEADLGLVSGAKKFNATTISVFPNPVGNAKQLTVRLSGKDDKIAVYNAVGQKMMEKVSTGNVARFDVSGLTSGMYVIRLSDGSSQKFIK